MDIAFLKTFFIGIAWVAVAVIVPAVLDGKSKPGFWLYTFEKFFFIVAITLPFDLRDIHRDLHTNTRTIANQYGYQTVMEWCAIFFVLSQFCHYQLFLLSVYTKLEAMSLIAFNCLSYLIIFIGCKKQRNDVFYLGILDGLIVIQGLIYILLYNLKL
jgi:4-hydroxybenzoate polyprenyltransferase